MIDEGYLKDLIEENYDGLVRFLMLRYPQIANDAVHEAYLVLRKYPQSWPLIRDPKAFLYKVALREARRMAHHSAWARHVVVDSELVEICMDESIATAGPDSAQIHIVAALQAFGRLTELQGDVYLLHVVDKMSAREIAEALNQPEHRVARALAAARRAMKATLSHSPQG